MLHTNTLCTTKAKGQHLPTSTTQSHCASCIHMQISRQNAQMSASPLMKTDYEHLETHADTRDPCWLVD